ncbi:PepSY-associated TM helix domain-containing protein [Alteromonas ponticola]|uniref:PepSY domain-containing protein n=1 Tax=Alteromonas ponticola TaxID=2720613 RepID=A0ABX1R0J0_9ALTE|nr:PepSY-associated TM helix domain-containing protein [Alteromonas ponticola]NMH59131.1 PepSY domain-containing protein [Alteromonas ponticola]
MPKIIARLNQSFHTWLGLLLSLWMLLMAITGTTLYFKSELLQWLYPALHQDAPLAQREVASILDSLILKQVDAYAYMPTDDAPWLEIVDSEKTHWYYTHQGMVLERPLNSDYISLFVSLHHDLMLGETGKNLLGILGLASLLLVVTGVIRWWPRHRISARLFKIHWFSLRSRKGLQTLGELHKVSAVLLFVPIVLVLTTGTAMIYSSPVKSLLVALLPQQGNQPTVSATHISYDNWQDKFTAASELLDGASPRLVYLSANKLRLKHDTEWHPNGRNYVSFSSAGKITAAENVSETSLGNQLSHTIYPLHVAAVGGTAFLFLATLTGLTLILIPVTGIMYWCKRRQYQVKR